MSGKPQLPTDEIAYRASTSTDLSPELVARLREAGLATTRREIAERCAETPRTVHALQRRAGLLRMLLAVTYISIPLRPCKLEDIPDSARSAARELGFQPLLKMLHGPLLPLVTPNFIGPEGFVKLEVFGGQRIYLFTYLDDGTEVETAPGPMLNARTVKLQGTADLERDYAVHLDQVLQIVRERNCRPIYRATPEALVSAWRLYPTHFIPLWGYLATVLAVLLPLGFVLLAFLAARK